MKVNTTTQFTDEHRRLVARFLGQDGLASHIQCSAWAKQQIESGFGHLRAAVALDQRKESK